MRADIEIGRLEEADKRIQEPSSRQNTLDELHIRERELMIAISRRGWWVNEGLWRKPRLVKSWKDVEAGRLMAAPLLAQDTFFHICFAIIFGQVRAQYYQDQSLVSFGQRFLGVWSILAFSGEYATRFNDDDIPHRFLWTGFGLGLLGVFMHTPADTEMVAMSFSLICLLFAVMNLRVSLHVQECRAHCLFFGVGLLLVSALWGLLACEERMQTWTWTPWLAASSHQWLSLLFMAIMPSADVPLNSEHHAARFSSVATMVIGLMVVEVAGQPTKLPPAERSDVYTAAIFCFLLLLEVRIGVFEVEHVAQSNHAMRCPRTRGTWRFGVQPCILLASNLVALAFGDVLMGFDGEKRAADPLIVAKGVRELCWSMAALNIALLFSSRQHEMDRAVKSSRRLRFFQLLQRKVLIGTAFMLILASRIEPLMNMPLVVLPGIAAYGFLQAALQMFVKHYLIAYTRAMDDGHVSASSSGSSIQRILQV